MKIVNLKDFTDRANKSKSSAKYFRLQDGLQAWFWSNNILHVHTYLDFTKTDIAMLRGIGFIECHPRQIEIDEWEL